MVGVSCVGDPTTRDSSDSAPNRFFESGDLSMPLDSKLQHNTARLPQWLTSDFYLDLSFHFGLFGLLR